MKLSEYHELADIDTDFSDSENIDSLSLKLPYVLTKWIKSFSSEALNYQRIKTDHDKIIQQRFHFYSSNFKKTISTKSEMDVYLNGDDEIIKSKLLLIAQKEKVDFIELIVKNLQQSSFNIKNAIEMIKFKSGS